jgi:hypothetical protein
MKRIREFRINYQHLSLSIISLFLFTLVGRHTNLFAGTTPLSPLTSIQPAIVTETTADITTIGEAAITPECQISGIFTPEIKRWETDICRWSKEHKMDPDLIATVMLIESCGNHLAVSATGVRGLFQVTGPNLDGENPFDPNVSMAKGPAKVLVNELRAASGDVNAAMAGYNGGGKARDWVSGKITQNQFYWFLRNHGSGFWRTDAKASAKINEVKWYAQWANIYFEAKESRTDTLNKWLEIGGARMCDVAAVQHAKLDAAGTHVAASSQTTNN